MDGDITPLGERKCDIEANWLEDFNKYGNRATKYYKDFVNMVADGVSHMEEPALPQEDHQLTTDQHRVMKFINHHVRDGQLIKNFQLIVVGFAGTGKSFTLKEISKIFQANNISYKIVAATGTSAVNCSGSTLHSLFGFNIFQSWETLAKAAPSPDTISKLKGT